MNAVSASNSRLVIEARIQHLAGVIDGAGGLANQYDAMRAAAKLVRETRQEIAELQASLPAAVEAEVKAYAADIQVESVHKLERDDPAVLARTVAIVTQHGIQRTVSLPHLNGEERAAIIASGKLPSHVLKLDAEPAKALTKWIEGAHRGYLVG